MKCDKCSSEGAEPVEYYYEGTLFQRGFLCKHCNREEIIELWGVEDEDDDN